MSLSLELNSDSKKWAVDELKKLARIPSVSFDGFDPANVRKSGEATAELFKSLGFQNVEITSIDNSHPYVLAEWKCDQPNAPTVLLYAHHDVQPEGRSEVWKTKPFEPTEKDGRLYGRGTADDKAGILVHAGAFKLFKDSDIKKLGVNLKVIIEGEEECGSSHLEEFLKQNIARLKSDVIVVTDTNNIDSGVPSMITSLRGIAVVSIEVKSMKAPLHSGMWGGGIQDPTQALVKMLAAVTDANGKMLLKSIGPRSKKTYADIPVSREEFAKQAEVLKLESVPQDFWTQVWDEPQFSINAIQASSEKLANNSICERAFARVGIRVTEREKATEVQKELVEILKKNAPSWAEVSFKLDGAADAWATDPKAKGKRWAFEAAEQALENAFKRKSVYIGCGGSIPFIAPFEESLGAPVITFGVEDPYTLAHSENESLLLSDFFKAIEAEAEFFRLLPKAFASR